MELAVTEICTRELLDKLAVVLDQPKVGVGPVEFVRRARDAGIGLVDLDRHRCLIDERVYESALHRGRVGAAYLKPRQPSPEAWRTLCPKKETLP